MIVQLVRKGGPRSIGKMYGWMVNLKAITTRMSPGQHSTIFEEIINEINVTVYSLLHKRVS